MVSRSNAPPFGERQTRPCPDFLPMSLEEAAKLGWDGLDIIIVTGDAYVDHPSFGAAIIGKFLCSFGYNVGVIAQPRSDEFTRLGRPRLAFMVTGGNVDSMVCHYTAAKKRRSDDYYTPGGKAGSRPDRAVITYSRAIREHFGGVPIVLGGLEASLRRLAHYDYWDDRVRRSILLDADGDLLVYGMGERATLDVADRLRDGTPVKDITDVKGTVYRARKPADGAVTLPTFDEVRDDKAKYAESFRLQYLNRGHFGSALSEKYGKNGIAVQNPPAKPLDTTEMDYVYALNFAREQHPSYASHVPAIDEVRFSVTSSRGCFGACAFCALSFHQGNEISARSHESITAEVKSLTKSPLFKGYIHDVGGPTANFRRPSCDRQKERGVCPNKRCLAPQPCEHLIADHSDYLALLRKLRTIDGVKKVFIRSGVRFDYILHDKVHGMEFLRELCEHHVSGQLKIAPEHICDGVLRHMGKPSASLYKDFADRYRRINEKLGKEQYIVPYLMSSHPGSTLNDAVQLAEFLRDNRINPEQVQDFYPTPGTIAACMYHTGLDPMTGKTVFVAKTARDKALQRALIQYRNPANYNLTREALTMADRGDLIGFHKKALIKPYNRKRNQNLYS